MTQTTIVAANWKMNGCLALVDSLTTLLNNGNWSQSTQVVIAPPAPYLHLVASKVKKEVTVAAQNIHFEASGAFTGEIRYFRTLIQPIYAKRLGTLMDNPRSL